MYSFPLFILFEITLYFTSLIDMSFHIYRVSTYMAFASDNYAQYH